jgi:hypothetical protein
MKHLSWVWILGVGLLASGCADMNYAIHRHMTGLDCRPEVIRQHNGQCAPVKPGGAS